MNEKVSFINKIFLKMLLFYNSVKGSIVKYMTKKGRYLLHNVLCNAVYTKLLFITYNIKRKERMFFMNIFKIPVTPTSTQKTIRFPDNIINRVEDAIEGKECTFSAFVIEATRVALEQIGK